MTLAAIAAATLASNAQGLRITEIQYTGLYGEFVEVTNTNANGGAAIDLANVQYTDNHAFAAGYVVDLASSTLLLQPGQSFIITEAAEEIFALAWYTLPAASPNFPNRPTTLAGIKGDVTVNLGRADAVELRNKTFLTFIDKLEYNDQAAAGSSLKGPRTEDISAVPNVASGGLIPPNNFSTWITSGEWKNGAGTTLSQPVGSATPWKSGRAAAVGTVGSPGVYVR